MKFPAEVRILKPAIAPVDQSLDSATTSPNSSPVANSLATLRGLGAILGCQFQMATSIKPKTTSIPINVSRPVSIPSNRKTKPKEEAAKEFTALVSRLNLLIERSGSGKDPCPADGKAIVKTIVIAAQRPQRIKMPIKTFSNISNLQYQRSRA
jgi:hypothetical protein